MRTWGGCYDDGWGDLIVKEAFAHPAKYARGLIQRIIETGLARRYWKPGDTIGDPFGGIASGGIMAGYHGLNWLGVELEPRFVELGNRNLAMHGPRFDATAAKDAEAAVVDEQQRAEKSAELFRQFAAKLDLATSPDEIKKIGKEITPAVKAQMLPADVARLREHYLAREKGREPGQEG